MDSTTRLTSENVQMLYYLIYRSAILVLTVFPVQLMQAVCLLICGDYRSEEVVAVASMNYDPIVSRVAEVFGSGKTIRKRDVE